MIVLLFPGDVVQSKGKNGGICCRRRFRDLPAYSEVFWCWVSTGNLALDFVFCLMLVSWKVLKCDTQNIAEIDL